LKPTLVYQDILEEMMKSHLRPWIIIPFLVCSSLACDIINWIDSMTDPGPMWVERVDVDPSEGNGKFSVSVLVLSHTDEDTLTCYYGFHSTHGETVYQEIVPPNDESETVRFEFTLTEPGSYDLTCTPEKQSIPASTTFIVTSAPTITPPVSP
jgi:hypothetical protein